MNDSIKLQIIEKSARFNYYLNDIVVFGNMEVESDDVQAFIKYAKFFSVNVCGGMFTDKGQWMYIN